MKSRNKLYLNVKHEIQSAILKLIPFILSKSFETFKHIYGNK